MFIFTSTPSPWQAFQIFSLIKESVSLRMQALICSTSHTASQADGKTAFMAIGEVHLTLSRGALKFTLQAVVIKELDCEILVGMHFMKINNIVLNIPKDSIVTAGKHTIPYSITGGNVKAPVKVNRSQCYLLRSPSQQVLLPGDGDLNTRWPEEGCRSSSRTQVQYPSSWMASSNHHKCCWTRCLLSKRHQGSYFTLQT